jgi:hypothetical protein
LQRPSFITEGPPRRAKVTGPVKDGTEPGLVTANVDSRKDI